MNKKIQFSTRITLATVLLTTLLLACSRDQEETESTISSDAMVPADQSAVVEQTTPELLWETSGFANPESMIHDSARSRIYVSSIGAGGPIDNARDGFISILAEDGSVQEMQWLSDLQAPKGMALVGDSLYIADLDRVLEVQVASGEIINTWVVAEAGFLNDITADAQGNVYISDMTKDLIYVVADGELDIWLDSFELEGPNGLYALDEHLVVASWGVMTDGFNTDVPGHIKTVQYLSKGIDPLHTTTPLGNLDGLEQDREGNFIVTDWSGGKVYMLDKDGKTSTLLSLNKGTADIDIGYVDGNGILLLPLMQDNKVQAYKLP